MVSVQSQFEFQISLNHVFEMNDFEEHFFSNFSEIKLRVRKGVREVAWPRQEDSRRRRGRSH